MEKAKDNDKELFLQTGNDGKVFWSKDQKQQEDIKLSDLGNVECGECRQLKPFEQVRWNREELKYLCSDCRKK